MNPLRDMHCVVAAIAVAALVPVARAAAGSAIEYYHAGLDHYFVSPLAPDIAALDSGRLAGWVRTGQSFTVALAPAGGENPVCRFYIPPQHGDSHFLSASPAECAAVLQKIATDPNYSGYVYETPSAFYIALPDTTTGACPAGTVPVYRLWNGRADSNHRLTADGPTRALMLARGYAAEGYGPDGVAMCAPGAVNAAAQVRVTGMSPFAAGCERVQTSGVAYVGTEVEPMLAVNPADPRHLLAIWQQDRWSNGGSRGVLSGVSRDGGATWTATAVPFSRCAGGAAANGGDYPRVSNPWVAFAPDGTAYATAISFGGGLFSASSFSAILVSRSRDGGTTWESPTTLIRDTNQTFNDKVAVTADPADARFAYVVWDRLASTGHGPSYFARTVDGGASWEPARPIYDPGGNDQTINNQIVVASDGTLVDFFTLINNHGNNADVSLAVVRSADRGVTWSNAVIITPTFGVGTHDPDTGAPIRDGTFCGSIAAGPNGLLVAVWQDARFSAGARDGVAMARSLDGGLTWSAPVQVNRKPDVQALVPAAAIRSDGTIGITYYDLRSNTPDPATLLTDSWLVQSPDGGATWQEMHLNGPFDLTLAPVTDTGYFLGDYEALIAVGNKFVPMYVTTNAANAQSASDILATIGSTTGAAASATLPKSQGLAALPMAREAPPVALTPEFAQRVRDNLRRALAGRLPMDDQQAPTPY